MCIGNLAKDTSAFINGQLGSHYSNAVRRTGNCGQPTVIDHKVLTNGFVQSTCLAEYRAPLEHRQQCSTLTDPSFEAKFNCPTIQFVCNHELVLFLDIRDGCYGKGTSNRKNIYNSKFAFRIPFRSQTCRCGAADDGDTYTLYFLDMLSAEYLKKHSSCPKDKDEDLDFWANLLAKFYLPVLTDARCHVFYSLPRLHKLTREKPEHFTTAESIDVSRDTLFNVDVMQINEFLRREAVWFHEETDTLQETIKSRAPSLLDSGEISLSLLFGSMQVRALCRTEVVLYLELKDLYVYKRAEELRMAAKRLQNWKLAFISNVMESKEESYIKLLTKSASFCEGLSEFGRHGLDAKLLAQITTTLICQITTRLMHSPTSIIIYRKPPFISGSEIVEPGSLDLEKTAVDILKNTHTDSFDAILTLTQGSINAHFRALWETHERRRAEVGTNQEVDTCLASVSFGNPDHGDEEIFSATFGPPRVQFSRIRGSKRVIFYINFKEGFLKTLGLGKRSRGFSFEDWCLAFEVDLRIAEASQGTNPASERLLILDLSQGLKFNGKLSDLPDTKGQTPSAQLLRQKPCIETDQIDALTFCIEKRYFPALQRAGCHVLRIIPRSLPNKKHEQQLFTSLDFEICPFTHARDILHPDGSLDKYSTNSDRNTIVIGGMTCGRKLPSLSLPRVSNWICGTEKDIPFGVLYLSRTAFLEGFLLEKLERVNRETTIVPRFFATENGGRELRFETLDKHNKAGCVPSCKWKTKGESLTSLEYGWDGLEKDSCRHESGLYGSREYVATCVTRNVITFPIGQSKIPQIRLTGTVELCREQGSSREGPNSVTVTWSANIHIKTTSSGLKVEVHYDGPHSERKEDDAVKRIFSQLRTKLDGLDNIIDDWRNELEGTWNTVQVEGCEHYAAQPMFNEHGNLVLELIQKGHADNRIYSLADTTTSIITPRPCPPVHPSDSVESESPTHAESEFELRTQLENSFARMSACGNHLGPLPMHTRISAY